VNYYERHLGDYAKDTGHLSLLEHGVYTLLLDRYYATEQGIPADQAHRVARARTDEERGAVDAVLNEFFRLEENLWVNGRVEEELGKARGRIENARQNGKKGGRPAKKNPDETQKEPSGFLVGSENETQTKAHQAPPIHLTNQKQKQERASPTGSRLSADWGPSGADIEFAINERPDVDWRKEAAKFRDYWAGKAGKDGRKADWSATWRNWIRRADGQPASRAGPALARANPQASPPSKTLSAIQQLQGMKHGNQLDSRRNSGRPEPAALLESGSDTGGGHDRWDGNGLASGDHR
jgi:uncharacterized protein YdaU (DUF1376 family)